MLLHVLNYTEDSMLRIRSKEVHREPQWEAQSPVCRVLFHINAHQRIHTEGRFNRQICLMGSSQLFSLVLEQLLTNGEGTEAGMDIINGCRLGLSLTNTI